MKDVQEERIRKYLDAGNKYKAFRLVVESFSEPLYWHIRRMVISHEDTDDILQNVFLKVWSSFAEFHWNSRLYTWMYRIATNESINFLNDKRRKVYGNCVGISSFLLETLKSDPFIEGSDIELELQRKLLLLTDRQRLIFNMRYFENKSYHEIARDLNISVGTVKSTYHQAVKKIENEFKN